MRDIFERIFNTNGWSSAESVSGTGSTLEQTTVIRERLPELFKKYAIKILLDIPCGDFHWMSLVPKEGIHYIGGDIVGGLVDRLSQSHHHDFCLLDVTASPLPAVDLILTRDCFVHLSNAAIFAAVAGGVYPTVEAAQKVMASRVCKTYQPNAQAAAAYEGLYQQYLTLAAFESQRAGGKA